ncbi:antigen 43 domain protein [Escherichia coli DEC12B]|nr:antigen 43 domain protein [Escherichia coli DEC12B]
MDYDRILAGSRSHQTGVNGENNSVRLSIQGGHLGHDNNGGIARGATPESSGSYGFVRLEGDLLRTEVAGMSLTTGVYGAAGHSSVDVKDDDGSRAGTSGMMPAAWRIPESDTTRPPACGLTLWHREPATA